MDISPRTTKAQYKIIIISLIIIILFLIGIIISMFIYFNYKLSSETKPKATSAVSKNISSFNNYIIPYSSKILINYTAINSFSENRLILAADEILARHGSTFSDCPNTQKYFSEEEWYKSNKNFKLTDLSSIELGNYKLIENQLMIVYASTNDPSISSQYVFPSSNIKAISKKEISSLNDWQLVIAKNEILARHGYVFSSNILSNYFNNTNWYTPIAGVNKLIKLNSCEKRNLNLINTILNQRLKTLKHLDITANINPSKA